MRGAGGGGTTGQPLCILSAKSLNDALTNQLIIITLSNRIRLRGKRGRRGIKMLVVCGLSALGA